MASSRRASALESLFKDSSVLSFVDYLPCTEDSISKVRIEVGQVDNVGSVETNSIINGLVNFISPSTFRFDCIDSEVKI